MGLAAFNRLRRLSREKQQEPEEIPEVLLGSNYFESTYEIGDKTVSLGELVGSAFENSELTVQKWNELPEEERDSLIGAVLEEMQAAVAGHEQMGGEKDQPGDGNAGAATAGTEVEQTGDGAGDTQDGDTSNQEGSADDNAAKDDAEEREKLAAEYKEQFGKSPHGAMKTENIRKKLEEAKQ